MIRFIFWLSIFTSFSLATPLFLDATQKISNTISHQITIEDQNHTLNSQDILYNRFNSFTTNTKSSYSKSVFWTKGVIQNNSNQKLDLIFRNLRAGTDFIDVFIFDGDKLLFSYLLGDQREQSERKILSSKSMFYLGLNPNQKLTIITKYRCWGSFDLFWQVLPMDQYSHINGIENTFYGAFGGIIIALILYNMMMFFSLKETAFLFYVAQGFCILWFIYSMNGVLYFFDMGIELRFITASTWIASSFMLLFLLFFILDFFKISQKNKILTKIFYGFSFGLVLFLAIWIYGYLVDETVFIKFSPLYGNFTFLLCIFVLGVIFGGMLKKIDGATYLFLGESFYLFGAIYTIFILKGEFNNESLSNFAIPLGVAFEMIFFSLALGSKIKKIKVDLENSKLIALQEAHYTEYGKIVGNISHQWKQPLSYLSSQIMYLSSLKTVNKGDMIEEEFLAVASKLNYTIELMANTINLFNDFYQNPNEKKVIYLKKELQNLISMYEYKLISNQIEIRLECDEKLEFFTFKVSFLQIIMTLLDNSIEQFEKNELKEGLISLTLKKENTTLLVIFEDNAGGIKLPIESIFEPHISSKNKKGGMGLHILKTILTEKLFGKIEAKNSVNGAVFTLELPLKN